MTMHIIYRHLYMIKYIIVTWFMMCIYVNIYN